MSDPRSHDPARLELKGITTTYADVRANDAIDLTVRPGEIHALLGENGAGKSTLVKAVYGMVRPDQGAIYWNGQQVQIPRPSVARSLGIGMVFQHFSLFETLTVAENIALAFPGKLDLDALAARIKDTAARYRLPMDPSQYVHTLSAGERQRVEIIRCLLNSPSLLIMDEPTSVLTPTAIETLFETLRTLANEGCSIVYISHKLREIKALCHTATILRDGQVTGTVDPREVEPEVIAQMMVGRALSAPSKTPPSKRGEPRLVVSGLSAQPLEEFGTALEDIALELRAGEIVGIAGISGNGQRELLQLLSGERPVRRRDDTVHGEITLNGTPIEVLNAGARRTKGLGFVPEDRLDRASVGELPLRSNALLTAHREQMVRAGTIVRRAVDAFAKRCIERFDVKSAGPNAAARSLSGGNLQKFVVGREILQGPNTLIVSQPTWGVDFAASEAIHQSLLEIAENGAAVLVISEDLDELFGLCDRIGVISRGRLSALTPTAETSLEAIGLLMSEHAGHGGDTRRGADTTAATAP